MTTKFDIGDSVCTIYRNRVCFVKIKMITITYEKIVYTFADPDIPADDVSYKEFLLFATKDELLKSL